MRSTACRRAPPSEEELKGSRTIAPASSCSRTLRAGASSDSSSSWTCTDSADYLNGYVQRVYAVTPQQIQEMAKKYLKDDTATIVVVGDKKVVTDQLKEFGPLK